MSSFDFVFIVQVDNVSEFQQAYATFILKCVVVRDEDSCRCSFPFLI
jgi:hypothetical protein